jgi:hypothetical protein
MLRIPLALFTVATSFSLFAQEKAPMAELAGPLWTVIGSGTAMGECKPGDAIYTFKAEPAQVVVKECEGRHVEDAHRGGHHVERGRQERHRLRRRAL